MNSVRPLSIPVILGTPGRGRTSAHMANFVLSELRNCRGVTTELNDIELPGIPMNDAGEEVLWTTFSQ